MSSPKTAPTGSFDRIAARRHLRKEIDELNRQQSDALKTATFLGMTPQQATEYDDRRKTIGMLVRQLADIESSP